MSNANPWLPPIPRRRVVIVKRKKPLVASHVSLAARLTRITERAVLDIEQRLAVLYRRHARARA